MKEDDLWDMSDEDLESAYKDAMAQEDSPETEISDEVVESSDEELTLDTEEDENGSDQPEELLEESDHDTSDKSEDEEVTTNDPDESVDETLDKEDETEEEEDIEETTDSKEEKQQERTYTFKANGKDYEFSSDEIVDQFPKMFGKAMDYTKKMKAIKPWRKTIDALSGANVSHEDVNLMIDVLNGDKDAMSEVLKRTGTDLDALDFDAEVDSNYIAKDYGRNEGTLAISDIVDEISQDVEYSVTQNILSKEWDEKSWETIAENPEMIRLLHTDVKSGMYKTLQPIAEKLKVYDGAHKPDLDYYKEAAQQYSSTLEKQNATNARIATREKQAKETIAASDENQKRITKAKEQSSKRIATKNASAKRKAAATTKSTAADRVVDYLDDSDESFDEWYKQLQDSSN